MTGRETAGLPDVLLSFDVEDWQQLAGREHGFHPWDLPRPAFRRQMRAILGLLDEYDIIATFFVLGITAKNYPDVIEDIAVRGHEIASHGNTHEPVCALTSDELVGDLEAAADVIERTTGVAPQGFRAPCFSISHRSPWPLQTLADLGYRYDSSQYDCSRLAQGFRGVPRRPYRMQLPSGGSIVEMPVAVTSLGPFRLPVGGGGYWRVLPRAALTRSLRRLVEGGGQPVLYFHPYEFDPDPLRCALADGAGRRARALAAWSRAYCSPGRGNLRRTFRAVAETFHLGPLRAALGGGADDPLETLRLNDGGHLACTR